MNPSCQQCFPRDPCEQLPEVPPTSRLTVPALTPLGGRRCGPKNPRLRPLLSPCILNGAWRGVPGNISHPLLPPCILQGALERSPETSRASLPLIPPDLPPPSPRGSEVEPFWPPRPLRAFTFPRSSGHSKALSSMPLFAPFLGASEGPLIQGQSPLPPRSPPDMPVCPGPHP